VAGGPGVVGFADEPNDRLGGDAARQAEAPPMTPKGGHRRDHHGMRGRHPCGLDDREGRAALAGVERHSLGDAKAGDPRRSMGRLPATAAL